MIRATRFVGIGLPSRIAAVIVRSKRLSRQFRFRSGPQLVGLAGKQFIAGSGNIVALNCGELDHPTFSAASHPVDAACYLQCGPSLDWRRARPLEKAARIATC